MPASRRVRPSRWTDRHRRWLRRGLVLSLILHLILLTIFTNINRHIRQVEPNERVATTTSTIQIEKRVKPQRAFQPHPQIEPQHTVQAPQRPVVHPITVPKYRPLPSRILKPTPVTHPRPASVPHPAKQNVLSQTKIAALNREFAQKIAEARAGDSPLNVPQETPEPPAHFRSKFKGGDIDLGGAHGLCDPVQSWQADGFDYYYLACNVVFDDGHEERQGVPWPVRYPPRADPFNGTLNEGQQPIPGPMVGFKLGPGQYVSKELREYAHEHGVDI
jgi:hypothetical protein